MRVDLSNQLCLPFSESASKHQPRKNTSQCPQSSDLTNWPAFPRSWPAAAPPLAAVSSRGIPQRQEGQRGCYRLRETQLLRGWGRRASVGLRLCFLAL